MQEQILVSIIIFIFTGELIQIAERETCCSLTVLSVRTVTDINDSVIVACVIKYSSIVAPPATPCRYNKKKSYFGLRT